MTRSSSDMHVLRCIVQTIPSKRIHMEFQKLVNEVFVRVRFVGLP